MRLTELLMIIPWLKIPTFIASYHKKKNYLADYPKMIIKCLKIVLLLAAMLQYFILRT
jgi:hypothetical protein